MDKLVTENKVYDIYPAKQSMKNCPANRMPCSITNYNNENLKKGQSGMNRILFLTSSPVTEPGGMFNNENGFVDKLRKAAEKNKNALFITASPDDAVGTKKFADSIRRAAKLSDMEFDFYHILAMVHKQ